MLNRPVRVLQVFHGMDCGGAENMIMNIYRHIDREKIQFDFLVHTDKKCFFDEEILALGGRILRIPYYNGFNYITYINAVKQVFKNYPEINVVHGHLGSCANIYLKVAKQQGKYTIVHSHNTKPNFSIKNIIYRINTLQVRKIADYFIGCSDAAGIYRYGRKIVSNSQKYSTLKNAINTESYLFNPAIREKVRSDLHIKDEIVLGHVGRFNEQKNHDYLIQIMENVVKVNSNAKLVLVGDGLLKSRIVSLVEEKGLKNNVLFLGLRHDVNELLQGMDCFVFPSLFEGLPVTIIEAQAASLPCVISDTITQEVKISDLVYFKSIEQNPYHWVDTIINSIKESNRINRRNEISNSGYDISDTTKWITNLYINAIRIG